VDTGAGTEERPAQDAAPPIDTPTESRAAEATPPPPSAAYLAYLADDHTVYQTRLLECLNVEAQSASIGSDEASSLAPSIDRGYIRFDANVAAACVAALRAAGCDEITRRYTEQHRRWPRPPTCPGALTPQVERDRACLVSEDCASPVESQCLPSNDQCSRAMPLAR
jgi:hypothetical protein